MTKRQTAKLRAAYFDERVSELHQLAAILSKIEGVRSVDPLNQAHVGKLEQGECWSLSLSGLTFDLEGEELEAQRHAKPPGLASVELVLDVRLEGWCVPEDSLRDPFRQLSVECVLAGTCSGETIHHSAWHLERHGAASADGDFAHPAYHLQYGGMRLPKKMDIGHHLLLDSPRVAHPPLDAVLAIDFVVSNYMPRLWHDLRNERPEYEPLVERAQARCWRPYAQGSTARWSAEDSGWDGPDIWPQTVYRGESGAEAESS